MADDKSHVYSDAEVPARLAAEPVARRGTFAADVGILYQMMTFQLKGDVEVRIDRPGGRFDVTVSGQGDGIANRIESSGVLRDGRWVPLRGSSWFQVRGRESRTQVTYDYERHVIEYHARAETFFLRRLRVVGRNSAPVLMAGGHDRVLDLRPRWRFDRGVVTGAAGGIPSRSRSHEMNVSSNSATAEIDRRSFT